MMLTDYPNFFLMLGPNTPIGDFYVIAISEVQGDYVIKIIDKWRNHEFDEFEAKLQAIDEFNVYMKQGLKGRNWVDAKVGIWIPTATQFYGHIHGSDGSMKCKNLRWNILRQGH